MTKSTSLFLDVLRVLAALIVFAAHVVDVDYPGAIWFPAHAAVIVFFVLSGYVIAFSTLHKKGMNVRTYTIARLSRLYSVVIPALLLTLILVICGNLINPSYYGRIVRDYEFERFIINALFLQSIWWRNLVPHDNGPFWSLGYEFWYYVVFGVLIFGKKWQWKTILILICCLIVGENVILLFPLWIWGACLYRYRNSLAISQRMAVLGFLFTLILTIYSTFSLPEYPGKVGVAPLFYAASYLTDWILGFELGAMIWFYTKALEKFSYPDGFARGVQWSANHTFSLYLYHYPCILFFAAVGIFNPHVWWQAILEIGLILTVIIMVSEVTESKRGLWKKVMESIWERWEPKAATIAGTPDSP
jgi:peptidoglycan/LPS O-acetylase OafA/YrhL